MNHPAATSTRTTHILALGLLAAVGCKRAEAPQQPQLTPAESAAPLHVGTAVAQARELPQTVPLTGTLVPDQQSEVTPLVSGRVTEVLVERGAAVREGQPLVRLRDVDFRSAAAAANAMLAQSQARLGLQGRRDGDFNPENTADVRAAQANRENAEDVLRRTQQLAQSGSVSDQDLQRAAAAAAAAREQYQSAVNNTRASYYAYRSARVQLDQQRRNVSDSVVRAPFAGEIAERKINVGEYVTPQRAVVTLVRTDPLRIELQVPQERIRAVQRGQAIDLRVDAYPDQVFHGTVRYISAAVRADNRSLVAEAIVPNPDGRLRPGLFATARINLAERQAAVAVPASAVVTEAGTSRVFVIDNGRAQERVVVVADRSPREVLVTRGVEANERVATDQLDKLADGARVQ